MGWNKGRLRASIFELAETVHLIWLCYSGDTIRCDVSAANKMVARNRPLALEANKNMNNCLASKFYNILRFPALFSARNL